MAAKRTLQLFCVPTLGVQRRAVSSSSSFNSRSDRSTRQPSNANAKQTTEPDKLIHCTVVMKVGVSQAEMEGIVKAVEGMLTTAYRQSSSSAGVNPTAAVKTSLGVGTFDFKVPADQKGLIERIRKSPKVEVVVDTFEEPKMRLM